MFSDTRLYPWSHSMYLHYLPCLHCHWGSFVRRGSVAWLFGYNIELVSWFTRESGQSGHTLVLPFGVAYKCVPKTTWRKESAPFPIVKSTSVKDSRDTEVILRGGNPTSRTFLSRLGLYKWRPNTEWYKESALRSKEYSSQRLKGYWGNTKRR